MRVPRDMRALDRLARQQGWELAPSAAGHLAWHAPTGSVVMSSSSPSDWRAPRKLKRDLRRAGLLLPR